ncbi:MAG: acyl-CoA dehydrogenase family protein [Leptospiraceae bacterium]|nr:acyl-CoA dehydrogenase family protein [Leptospiraceae bacterium]MDW8306629.1 acyl-CoA dehydrogenase family protein [Leptospiraceae bacterium]
MKYLTELSSEEKEFFEAVRDFARREVEPLVRKMDEKGETERSLIPKFYDMGLMGVEIPEKYGGAGASFFMAILAVEAMSQIDPSMGVLIDVQNTLVNNAFLRWGSPELKEKYLPQLATRKVGSYCLSESSSGSDAFSLKCRAIKKGDRYILNGHKLWITNAAEAEIFIVMANLNPEAGYKGITAFVVERDFPGFRVSKKEDKLGIRASSTCELVFEDCEVPLENLLGEEGKGYKVAIETLNEGRIGIAAQMLGLAEAALAHAIAYTKQRVQFGKPVASFQGMQFQLAQMATYVETARLMVYNAARMKDAGVNFVKEAAMAKYHASEVAEKVASLAVECFGGYGFTKDYPVEKLYRDAKIGKIYEGTSFMQLATIAKIILEDRL